MVAKTSATKLTMTEAMNSLNGVEYDNANRLSKGRFMRLLDEDAVEAMYVLITVLTMRENRQATLGKIKADTTIGELKDYFEPEPDLEDETSADTPAGNA